MPSKNIFITDSTINKPISLKNNEEANIFIVLDNTKDCIQNININLLDNNKVDLYSLILSNNNKKEININIKHNGNFSSSYIRVKALANHNSKVKINCISLAKSNTTKNEINQVIDGLIFDDKSSIETLPSLDINIDDISAKHTVNIGQVDPEIIFYLNSKGLSTIQAYQFLIDSFIKELEPFAKKYKINLDRDIKSLMEGK